MIGIGIGIVLMLLAVFAMGWFRVPEFKQGISRLRFSFLFRSAPQVVSFDLEAGYQPKLFLPGWHWVLWPLYTYELYDQVSTENSIGYVIANVGKKQDGAYRMGPYHPSYGYYDDVTKFMKEGLTKGQIGIQHFVFPLHFTGPVHPIAFTVITRTKVYGLPTDPELRKKQAEGQLKFSDYGFKESDFQPTVIQKEKAGLVKCNDGPPLPKDAVVCRLGGFEDIARRELELRNEGASEETIGRELFQLALASKNEEHNNYQDTYRFFSAGGKKGSQYDLILEGSFILNRLLFEVTETDLVVVEGSYAGAIRAGAGLRPKSITEDAVVLPGYFGVWRVPATPGAYAVHPQLKIIPERYGVIPLIWGERCSGHGLDKDLKAIRMSSKDYVQMELELDAIIVIEPRSIPIIRARNENVESFIKDTVSALLSSFTVNEIKEHTADQILSPGSEQLDDFHLKLKKHLQEKLDPFSAKVTSVLIQSIVAGAAYMAVREGLTIAGKEIQKVEKETELAEAQVKLAKKKARAKVAELKAMLPLLRKQLGENGATWVEIMKMVSEGKIKLPDTIALGSMPSLLIGEGKKAG